MARLLRYAGLASIVIVEDAAEIDALIDNPNLDRTLLPEGPPLNRLMTARLRHALFRDGRSLLSFAPRETPGRATAQESLAKRLDAVAAERPWSKEAIAAMAD